MKIVSNINPNILGNMILGIYGTDITEDVAYTIGKSFGTYIKRMVIIQLLLVMIIVNLHQLLQNALIKGITDAGVNVINLGLVTTPMYYFGKYYYGLNTEL